MKHRFFVLLAVCTFSAAAAAMIPRQRRAVNTEEDEETIRFAVTTEKTTQKDESPVICDATTPCGWTIYHPSTRVNQMTILNSYCECDTKTSSECRISYDDSASNSYVQKCLPPLSSAETTPPEDSGSES